VQRLRAEDDVDERGALDDRGPLLTCDTAADGNHEGWVRTLELAYAAQVGKHLLLGLLADRAGVEHDDVRVLGTLGALQAVACRKDVGHAVRVVLVHLAAERADVDLAGRGDLFGAHFFSSSGRAASSGVRIQTRWI
jgi:hypothetical protein